MLAQCCYVYRDLVDRANEWLATHRPVLSTGLCVKTCETVTWMSADADSAAGAAAAANTASSSSSSCGVRQATDHSEQTLLSKSVVEQSKTYFTRGLRSVRRASLDTAIYSPDYSFQFDSIPPRKQT